jgi:hypothetical protein
MLVILTLNAVKGKDLLFVQVATIVKMASMT